MKNKHITHLLTLITLLGLFFLTACSLTPPKSMMNVTQGEQFQLKRILHYKPDQLSQFIQFGQLTSRNGFDRYDQHCVIELNNISDKPQTLYPETFTITKVRLGEQLIAQAQTAKPIYIAQAQTGIQSDMALSMWSSVSDNNRVETMDTVDIYLKPTSKNPNILRLKCAGALSKGDLQDAPRSYRPETKQINAILGSIGQIISQNAH